MSTNGEAADLAVRESIEVTESAMKLVGLGAKNLAALLIAVANDNQKVAGMTNIKRMLQDGEQMSVFSIKQEDLETFRSNAKTYGVLFCSIQNKTADTGTIEVVAKAKDAQIINHILEHMGYPAPAVEDTTPKKASTRVLSAKSSKERGRGANETLTEPPKVTRATIKRESTKSRLEALRKAARAKEASPNVPEAVKSAIKKATPER